MNAANVLISLAVLAFVIYRQLSARPVRDNPLRLILVLGAIGVVQTARAVQGNSVAVAAVALTVIGIVAGGVVGVWRAYTVRLWRAEDGRFWQKGTALTLVLWLLSLGVHVGLSLAGQHLAGLETLSSASLWLFLAVSLGAQRLTVLHRAGLPLGMPAQR